MNENLLDLAGDLNETLYFVFDDQDGVRRKVRTSRAKAGCMFDELDNLFVPWEFRDVFGNVVVSSDMCE